MNKHDFVLNITLEGDDETVVSLQMAVDYTYDPTTYAATELDPAEGPTIELGAFYELERIDSDLVYTPAYDELCTDALAEKLEAEILSEIRG